MRINQVTKYSDFAPLEPFVCERTIKELKRAAECVHGSMYDLPFATFYACFHGDFTHLGDLKNPTVLQVYWCKRFADFATEFANTLKSLELPQQPDEVRASNGLLKTDWGESVLVFLQSWFNLKSYKEAEQITIGELLIAKRAAYNQEKFRRNMLKIQMQNIKKK